LKFKSREKNLKEGKKAGRTSKERPVRRGWKGGGGGGRFLEISEGKGKEKKERKRDLPTEMRRRNKTTVIKTTLLGGCGNGQIGGGIIRTVSIVE